MWQWGVRTWGLSACKPIQSGKVQGEVLGPKYLGGESCLPPAQSPSANGKELEQNLSLDSVTWNSWWRR